MTPRPALVDLDIISTLSPAPMRLPVTSVLQNLFISCPPFRRAIIPAERGCITEESDERQHSSLVVVAVFSPLDLYGSRIYARARASVALEVVLYG